MIVMEKTCSFKMSFEMNGSMLEEEGAPDFGVNKRGVGNHVHL